MAEMELYSDRSTVRCVLKNAKGEVVLASFVDAKMFAAAKDEECPCVFQTASTDGKEEVVRAALTMSTCMMYIIGTVYPAVVAKIANTKLDLCELADLYASHSMSKRHVDEALTTAFREAVVSEEKKGGDDK